MTAKRIHGAVIILFAFAIIFYSTQWFDAAIIFGVLGIICEIAAWITWIITDKNNHAPETEE